jgi:hypothetical protein
LDKSGVDGLNKFFCGVDSNHFFELSRQVCFDNVFPMVFRILSSFLHDSNPSFPHRRQNLFLENFQPKTFLQVLD